jgi:uncharacterized protein YjiS (DUF1127 family)
MYPSTEQTLVAEYRLSPIERLARMARVVAECLRTIHEHRITRKEILRLDDNMLKDIGLTRDDLALGYEQLVATRQVKMAMIHGRRGVRRPEQW